MNTETQEISFSSFGIRQQIIDTLETKKISSPTEVQKKVIPAVSAKQHVFFQSETGTGKTLAYLLPLLNPVEEKTGPVQIIVCAPTHELASQIKQEIQSVFEIKAALCIGGAPMQRQIETLKERPVVVIGGPVRLMELINLKKLKTDYVTAIVLDEVDRLLSPELRDETCELVERICKINEHAKDEIQIIACSATIKQGMKRIISNFVPDGTSIEEIFLPQEDILRKKITHWAIFAEMRDKIDTLRKFLAAEKPQKALVFTSRADQVENIVSKLQFKKVDCEGLHAKTDKIKRKQAIDRFRSGKCPVLVTSDLAARGLDIPDITHIIQMDFPSNDDFFIHRAGRTARAGRSGINTVIGDEYEMKKYAALEKKLGITVYPKELHNGAVISPFIEQEKD